MLVDAFKKGHPFLADANRVGCFVAPIADIVAQRVQSESKRAEVEFESAPETFNGHTRLQG